MTTHHNAYACPDCGSAMDEVARIAGAELRLILAELVALKDGPRDADYERRKPLAWAAARRALTPPP